MGFFAGELDAILRAHLPHPDSSLSSLLTKLGVHPYQIERLQHAAEDIREIASLHDPHLTQLRQELALSPVEWARLQAGLEADTFLKLFLYHNYPLEEAINKANAVFAATLKDRLATPDADATVYVSVGQAHHRTATSPPRNVRRARKPKDSALTSTTQEP